MTRKLWYCVALLGGLCAIARADKNEAIRAHAHDLLARAGQNEVVFRDVTNLGGDEAFRVVRDANRIVVEHQAPAGALYGSQAVIEDAFKPGVIEAPDFKIRGTTLCLMSGGNSYKSTMSPEVFPWFYDKAFMTRTLDVFAKARINTLFVWSGHLFPYIVEMPDYPEAAADVPAEQVKANQKQFRWFTAGCEKRNIQVLLHFYNIHVSPPFAKKHGIRTNPSTPTPLLSKYTYYALSRYFSEFPSVGLYACPGESLQSDKQFEWFRDVVFKAAIDSGKNPTVVIRDWTLNADFQSKLKSLYPNVYSELKHNDESLTSPYPDVRHKKWEGLANGHIINAAHGPAEDLQPDALGEPGPLCRRWPGTGSHWVLPPAWSFGGSPTGVGPTPSTNWRKWNPAAWSTSKAATGWFTLIAMSPFMCWPGARCGRRIVIPKAINLFGSIITPNASVPRRSVSGWPRGTPSPARSAPAFRT